MRDLIIVLLMSVLTCVPLYAEWGSENPWANPGETFNQRSNEQRMQRQDEMFPSQEQQEMRDMNKQLKNLNNQLDPYGGFGNNNGFLGDWE